MVEVGLEIEDAPGIDVAVEDVVKQLRDVGAGGRYPTAQPDVAKDDGLHWVLDVVGDPDNANDRPGSRNAQRRRHRLAGADAFEGRVDADAIRQVKDRLDRGVAALGKDVGGTKRTGDVLTGRVSAEGDDSRSAQTMRRKDRAQTHRAVPYNGDDAARPNTGAHRGVVAGAHHVGEREERPHHFVRMLGAGHRDEGGAGDGHTDSLPLASVGFAVPKRTPGDALRCDPRAAVRARAVAVLERGDHKISDGDAGHVGADALHDADELMTDRAHRVRRLPSVVPEVGPANASQRDADDRVGGRGDNRVWPLANFYRVRSVVDG